jgi:hypothetical protein
MYQIIIKYLKKKNKKKMLGVWYSNSIYIYNIIVRCNLQKVQFARCKGNEIGHNYTCFTQVK